MIDNVLPPDNISATTKVEPEPAMLLFKYLDAHGAAAMLQGSNLQFTNATRLNDPFDCHPALIDFSKITPEQSKPWGREDTIALKSHPHERDRERAWICCLSKIHDSILMWSYYNDHKGVCIGLDIEKVKPYIHYMLGTMVFPPQEVVYPDIIDKPDFFAGREDFFSYQMLSKAKEWSHEQEVRMFILDPHQMCMDICLPYEPEDKNAVIDWKEVRAYPRLGAECFASIYFGINILERRKKKIIKIARKCNPYIKIYQMTVNPDAFRLDCIEVGKC